MKNALRCDACGARDHAAGAANCAYCGAVLPRSQPVAAEPFGDVAARIEALRAHRSFETLIRERPPDGAGTWPRVVRGAFGLLFAGVALFIWSRGRALPWSLDEHPFSGLHTSRAANPTDFRDVLPLLFVAIGAGMFLHAVWRVIRFRSAAWNSFPGVVIDKRTHVPRSDSYTYTRTGYHVTVEDERGRRTEFATTGNVAGGVSAGDVGIVHTRDGTLLGFRRFRG